MNTISERLKQKRMELNLTQAQLAEKAGMYVTRPGMASG